jgi:hypothetical protein
MENNVNEVQEVTKFKLIESEKQKAIEALIDAWEMEKERFLMAISSDDNIMLDDINRQKMAAFDKVGHDAHDRIWRTAGLLQASYDDDQEMFEEQFDMLKRTLEDIACNYRRRIRAIHFPNAEFATGKDISNAFTRMYELHKESINRFDKAVEEAKKKYSRLSKDDFYDATDTIRRDIKFHIGELREWLTEEDDLTKEDIENAFKTTNTNINYSILEYYEGLDECMEELEKKKKSN